MVDGSDMIGRGNDKDSLCACERSIPGPVGARNRQTRTGSNTMGCPLPVPLPLPASIKNPYQSDQFIFYILLQQASALRCPMMDRNESALVYSC